MLTGIVRRDRIKIGMQGFSARQVYALATIGSIHTYSKLWCQRMKMVAIPLPPREKRELQALVRDSFLQSFFYVIPSVKELAEVTRVVPESVKGDHLLIGIVQSTCLPTTPGLCDPQVGVDSFPRFAADALQPAEQFCGRDDDEAGFNFGE